MRRHSHRAPSRSANRLQLAYEKLEPKVLLACDMQLLDNGILQITGDEAAQTIRIVDRGGGMVSVQCQEPGMPVVSRSFSRATGIKAELNGGNDVLNYFSNQDVNATLPSLEFLLGAGDDRSNVEVTVHGTPNRARGFGFIESGGAGDDVMITTINSLTTSDDPTQPVYHGEMHGGDGQDEMTLISNTSAGGFSLTNNERGPSATGGTTQPDCLIWDLVDGTTGQASARAMGSEADSLIALRTDQRGVGRSNFEFDLDGGGGVNALNSYVTFVGDTQGNADGSIGMSNGAETRLQVEGIVDLVATSSSAADGTTEHFFTVEIAEGRISSFATLDIVGSESADNVRINVGENDLTNLEINVDGRGGDDVLRTVVNTLVDSGFSDRPVIRGEMHGGDGRDDMTLISNTAAGGFTLTKNERGPSAAGGTTQPDCLIWDLVDGTSGVVNAQAMGSQADETIELRMDPRGVGRSNFEFVLDGGGGVNALISYMRFVGETQGNADGSLRMFNGAETRLHVEGIVDLVATSSSAADGTTEHFFTVGIDEGRISSFATLDIAGSESADNVRINVGENDLTNLEINVDGRGGDDSVSYHMFLADGTPLRSAQIDINGGAGNDRMRTVVNTLVDSGFTDRPVIQGEMHGGDGRDEMTLISNTAAGGFTLTNKELGSSQGQTGSQPDCLIWDLIDGTSGQVNAHAVSSEVESLITLRTDARGVGRSNFDFVLDGGDGERTVVQAILIVGVSSQGQQGGHLTILEDYESQLDVHGIVELSASSSSRGDSSIAATRFGVSFDGFQSAAFLEIEGSTGGDDIAVRVGENRLDSLAINIDSGNGNDNVSSQIGNLTNRGRFQQTINTGAGSDTVIQSLQGFQNHGTATFLTRLGAGADSYRAVASDIYVSQSASLAMRVNGGGGGDLIQASVQATVDGAYRFVARGGRGDDVIRVAQNLDTNWRTDDEPRESDRPTIDILLEGNDGNDLLGLWVLIQESDKNLLNALVDGGDGDDTAFTRGPVRLINVEHHN